MRYDARKQSARRCTTYLYRYQQGPTTRGDNPHERSTSVDRDMGKCAEPMLWPASSKASKVAARLMFSQTCMAAQKPVEVYWRFNRPRPASEGGKRMQFAWLEVYWRFNRPRPASEGGKRMQFAELQLAELQAGGWRVGEGGSSRGRIRDWIGESVIRIHGTGPWHGMVRGVQDSLRSWNKHLVEAVD